MHGASSAIYNPLGFNNFKRDFSKKSPPAATDLSTLGLTHDGRLVHAYEYEQRSTIQHMYRKLVGTTYEDHKKRLTKYLCDVIDVTAENSLNMDKVKDFAHNLKPTFRSIRVAVKNIELELEEQRECAFSMQSNQEEMEIMHEKAKRLTELVKQKDFQIEHLAVAKKAASFSIDNYDLHQLVKPYQCSICLDVDTPKVGGPCGHLSCKDCFDKLSFQSVSKTICCPECRTHNSITQYNKVVLEMPTALKRLLNTVE